MNRLKKYQVSKAFIAYTFIKVVYALEKNLVPTLASNLAIN